MTEYALTLTITNKEKNCKVIQIIYTSKTLQAISI